MNSWPAEGSEIGGYRAALGLAWLSQSGAHTILGIMAREGPQRAWGASRKQLLGWGMAPGAVARFEAKRRRFAISEAEAALRNTGAHFLPFGSPYYPRELSQLSLPPAGLFVQADKEMLERLVATPRVTIVGTRRASVYGLKVARTFASAFASEDVIVVSGMALGIDASAHEAALGTGAPTVAVVGCGVDVLYPRSHSGLRRKIIQNGALVSELPPGTLPSKWTFPHRNRLLAALGDAVLVVEGSCTSGAMQTADRALELGRPVFSVPGPILVEGSEGCNRLLYEGAYPAVDPCRTVEDFFYLTRMERGERQRRRWSTCVKREQDASQSPPGPFKASWETILTAMGGGACSVDDLVRHTGLGVRELLVALAEMELAGCAVRAGSGLYIRAP